MEIIIGALKLGIIYSLVSLAIYLTLRIVDFPDMTVNSSFTLGASISGIAVVSGIHPIIATIFAIIGGALVGTITAWLHIARGIQNLLSGIIMMIALYSINLRILNKPNLPLTHAKTIFSFDADPLVILTMIVTIFYIIVSYFLLSNRGLAIRASGQNYRFGEAYGVSRKFTIYSILALSNALVALSGSLFSQLEGFVDIGMGNGIIIIGLASVIIGERLSMSDRVIPSLLSIAVGAILYRIIIAMSLMSSNIGFRTSDVYLATAVIIVLMMIGKKRTL